MRAPGLIVAVALLAACQQGQAETLVASSVRQPWLGFAPVSEVCFLNVHWIDAKDTDALRRAYVAQDRASSTSQLLMIDPLSQDVLVGVTQGADGACDPNAVADSMGRVSVIETTEAVPVSEEQWQAVLSGNSDIVCDVLLELGPATASRYPAAGTLMKYRVGGVYSYEDDFSRQPRALALNLYRNCALPEGKLLEFYRELVEHDGDWAVTETR